MMAGSTNCSLLLGIVPAEKGLFHFIRNEIRRKNIVWRDDYIIVPDQDNGGELTLLVTVIIGINIEDENVLLDNDDDDDKGKCFQLEQQSKTLDANMILSPQDIVNCAQDLLNNQMSCGHQEVRVELWASAPAPLPLWTSLRDHPLMSGDDSQRNDDMMMVVNDTIKNKEGERIRKNMDERRRISNSNDTEEDEKQENVLLLLDPLIWSQEKAEIALQKWGIVKQKQLLTLQEVQKIRIIVDEAIQEVEHSLSKHRPGIRVGTDTIIFKEIASRNLERFDLRLTSDQAINFVHDHVLHHVTVKNFLTRSLGDFDEIDFDVSVVYSKPGANTQGWHADGSHLNNAKDAGWDEDGWKTRLSGAYAICVFIPLIDLDYEVGFTQFWPGSHRNRDLIGFGPVAELTQSTFDAIGVAGDGIWYDYRLLHRGMPNRSELLRPVLQIIFKKKWYVERKNYGKESISDKIL